MKILSIQLDLSQQRLSVPAGNFEQRRLTRTVGADNGNNLARARLEADRGKLKMRVTKGDSIDLKAGVDRRGPRVGEGFWRRGLNGLNERTS